MTNNALTSRSNYYIDYGSYSRGNKPESEIKTSFNAATLIRVYFRDGSTVALEPTEIEVIARPEPLAPYRRPRQEFLIHGISVSNELPGLSVPDVKNVMFCGPATIVEWADGTKTVVKTQNNEPFDPEKGLAMAIVKKVFGNKGNYNNRFKKLLECAEHQIPYTKVKKPKKAVKKGSKKK